MTSGSTWAEGLAAHAAGKTLADNPYEEAMRNYVAWENGWVAARNAQIQQSPTDVHWARSTNQLSEKPHEAV